MENLTAKTLSEYWAGYISMGTEVTKLDLDIFIFDVSTLGGGLREFFKGLVDSEVVF